LKAPAAVAPKRRYGAPRRWKGRRTPEPGGTSTGSVAAIGLPERFKPPAAGAGNTRSKYFTIVKYFEQVVQGENFPKGSGFAVLERGGRREGRVFFAE
jgi:hypothetical protein